MGNQQKKPLQKKKTVYLAMSGGVDSSLSAVLLKESGFNVVGVFIKAWHPPFLECPWKEDRLDALRVATYINIPFKTVDLSKEYKKEVIEYLLREYKRGKTPNPDVMCNKTIKFGAFFKWAIGEGADYVATGHYAQVKEKRGHYHLYQGNDGGKDQSYFLWTLTQKQLKKTLFPVGHLKKEMVRKGAEKRGLITAHKKDSQGLCFVGKINFKEFLKKYIKSERGDVVTTKGGVIGWHEGAVFYTVGERHGFNITKKTPHDTPYYVVRKNIKNNTLTVAHKKELVRDAPRTLQLTSTSWVTGEGPSSNKKYRGRGRYRQKLEVCTIGKKKGGYTIYSKKPLAGVASGQSFVLYDKKECLGGGVIQ